MYRIPAFSVVGLRVPRALGMRSIEIIHFSPCDRRSIGRGCRRNDFIRGTTTYPWSGKKITTMTVGRARGDRARYPVRIFHFMLVKHRVKPPYGARGVDACCK